MAPGVQTAIIELVGKKIANTDNPLDCHTCLAIDEVAIHEKLEYDTVLFPR